MHKCNAQGDFDDAQAIVKAAFADETFRDEVKLGAINSINWARVMAQITYYFYSYLRVTDGVLEKNLMLKEPKVSYAVPTGNFGDILAGYYAKRMGLPVDKLVVCTNQNDVLHRFLQSGVYSKAPAVLTIAPSMDISVSSNFERYLYYLSNENGEVLAQWMKEFESCGELRVPADALAIARSEFLSFSADKDLITSTMRELHSSEGYLVCPHTATAVAAVQSLLGSGPAGLGASIPVCLATAHAAKFEEATMLALAVTSESMPARPPVLEELFHMDTRRVDLPNSLGAIQQYMRSKLKSTYWWTSALSGWSLSLLTAAAVVAITAVVVLRQQVHSSK